MNQAIKKKMFWTIGEILTLCVVYVLCRYTFGPGAHSIFPLHGMKEWPFTLLIVGLVTIVLVNTFDSRKIAFCTIGGYSVGFIFAMLFSNEKIDPSGGILDNAWIIWTVIFLVFVAIGVIWEMTSRHMKKKSTLPNS
jgi:hypothetical protein